MISRRAAPLAGLAWVAVEPAGGAEPSSPSGTPQGDDLYLPDLYRLEAAVRNGDRNAIQRLAWQRAFTGDEAGALAAWASLSSRPRTPVSPDFSGATSEPALPAILRASKDRRIVILNEAHHISRCRAFGAQLARALRPEGFSILAAEAFSPLPETRFAARMEAGEAVTADLGLYTRDPVFAELMRQARADGYRLAPYEATRDQAAPADADGAAQTAARESAQAGNLAALLNGNPDARLLVYCGFSHVAEAPLGPTTWMAARLKALTGLDPLTIDQSFGIPAPAAEHEPPLVTAMLDHFRPTAPMIVRRPDGAPWGGYMEEAVDLTVFQPRMADIDGRPGWLATAPDRVRRTFALPSAGPAERLVQAVPLAEASVPDAIPSDQYMAKPGAKEAVFFLRPGRYEIRMETDAGRRVLGTI
jgi:hypothetical protein